MNGGEGEKKGRFTSSRIQHVVLMISKAVVDEAGQKLVDNCMSFDQLLGNEPLPTSSGRLVGRR